jgi:TrpR-related protein YerC/YecD
VDDYKSKLQGKEMDFLFEAILSLKDREECYRFFEDICTINEIKALEQRLQVAKMLKQGKTYIDIAHATGASTATISRVNRSLNYGSDGYNLIFERLDWKESD